MAWWNIVCCFKFPVLALSSHTGSVLEEEVSLTVEKNMYYVVLEWNVLQVYVRSIWLNIISFWCYSVWVLPADLVRVGYWTHHPCVGIHLWFGPSSIWWKHRHLYKVHKCSELWNVFGSCHEYTVTLFSLTSSGLNSTLSDIWIASVSWFHLEHYFPLFDSKTIVEIELCFLEAATDSVF